MKLFATIILASIVPLSYAASNQLPSLSQMPQSFVSEGSLANAKLIYDTTVALIQVEYVQPNDEIVKFVMQQPRGNPGQKAWRELWVTSPEGDSEQFIITFTEHGQNAADFEIQKVQPILTQ